MNRMEMNKEARRMIAQIAEEKGLDRCELCGGTFGLAPAHRYPRNHYHNAKELADFREWLALDIQCHIKIDDRSQTKAEEKEQIFNSLREQSQIINN